MPMIDVYATDGTFEQGGQLAADLARTLMVIEGVPDIPMFRLNTAAFIHQMPAGSISNVEGQDNYVRVQVLTNAGALDREQAARRSESVHGARLSGGQRSFADRANVGAPDRGDRGWLGSRRPCEHQCGARRCRTSTIAQIAAAKDGGQK